MPDDPVPGRVSIVIPAFNSAGTVGAAVESCLAQRYGDVETIVVDDGSTDETARVLQGFGDSIKVLRKDNGGVASARNAGIRLATGEFIAWMDNDDVAHCSRIQVQVDVLASHPEIVLVSSDFSAFVEPGRDMSSSHIATYYSAVGRLDGIERIYPHCHRLHAEHPALAGAAVVVRWGTVYEALIEGNFVHPPTVMVRRSALDRAGSFDETLRYNSEYDMAVRLARLGPFAYVDAPLLRYRLSGTQLSSEARSRGLIPLETVRVLDKVRQEDPGVYARRRSLFRSRCGRAFASAAQGLGATEKARALGYLLRGMRHRIFPVHVMRALATIALPGPVAGVVRRGVRLVRSVRARLPGNVSKAKVNINS